MTTRFVLYVSLAVGTLSLAWGYQTGGFSKAVIWILVCGGIWALAQARRWLWVPSVGFLAAVTLAGFGLWMSLPGGWMLAGALGALLAWDLSDFERRLRTAAPGDDTAGLERRHLLRLTIIAGLAFLFSLFGMLSRLEFSFEIIAFLTLLAALGLTQLIGRMRRRDEKKEER
jgi:hypothetical protein